MFSSSEVWTCNLLITRLVSFHETTEPSWKIRPKMFVLSMITAKSHFWQIKCTTFKHILALPTYSLKCLLFHIWALKKSKNEPGHPVHVHICNYLISRNISSEIRKCTYIFSRSFVSLPYGLSITTHFSWNTYICFPWKQIYISCTYLKTW